MNKQTIHSDDLNVYVTYESSVKKWVKYLLLFLNILIYGGLILIVANIPDSEMKFFALPVLGFAALIFFTLTWSTVWNAYGKEILIINTKSFSYQKVYGLITTNLKTFRTDDGISMNFNKELTYTKEQYGTIVFFKYNAANLPETMYQTSIKTSYSNYKELIECLNDFFRIGASAVGIDEISLN